MLSDQVISEKPLSLNMTSKRRAGNGDGAISGKWAGTRRWGKACGQAIAGGQAVLSGPFGVSG